MWRALPLIVLIACGNKNNTPTPPEEGAADGAATPADGTPDGATPPADGGSPPPPPEPAAKPTPESLYAECKDRVEGKQAPDECKADADCKAAGCGTEVCTTVAEAANIMTTCEGRLCFKVLDTCGCHEGQCTWTLKAEVPEMPAIPTPAPLPPNRLPPTPPPAGGQ